MPIKFKNKINEGYLLPNPEGYVDVNKPKSYHKEINDLITDAIEKAKKEALTSILDKIKKELINKLICIIDDSNRQKIIAVDDVVIEKNGKENFLFLVEKDSSGERKIRFAYENPKGGEVFNMSRYLEFFEENFLDKYIQFTGKPLTGGNEGIYRKVVVALGVSDFRNNDYIIVECDDKTKLFLNHNLPINLIDSFLKELDPHSEEDWDN